MQWDLKGPLSIGGSNVVPIGLLLLVTMYIFIFFFFLETYLYIHLLILMIMSWTRLTNTILQILVDFLTKLLLLFL